MAYTTGMVNRCIHLAFREAIRDGQILLSYPFLTFHADGPVLVLRALHTFLCSAHADFWQFGSQYLNERSVSRQPTPRSAPYLAFSHPPHLRSTALGFPHHEHLCNSAGFVDHLG